MLTFRGIRYARAERFGQAEGLPFADPVPGERGPVSPQSPSRLELVMGPNAPLAQDEHCQVLSVFTPAREGDRPVMVFIHGGAFVTGGGELPWYDGHRLAGEQDVVVVTITYRLGALGYLVLPGDRDTDPSPGMSDQIAALRWVRQNIGAFGGDPKNVTVFGQSAGAMSIARMLEWGLGGELFDRAILQSGPDVHPSLRDRQKAEELSRQFIDILGADPRAASIADLVDAQGRLKASRKQVADWLPASPPDGQVATHVDLIAGWTKDDFLPFVLIEAGQQPGPDVDLSKFAPQTGDMNTMMFIGPCQERAAEALAAGKKAWLYRLDWVAQESWLGAPHCMDLPLLLGDRDAWSKAPMLGTEPWETIDSLGREVRARWASFARGLPPDQGWQSATLPDQPVNIIP
ncbi:carboxylesterase family protein [Streptosporangium sp. NPDC002544]|uniref:carboxylesterase family protein n=1 Tax=Streptosporangium sp. NPDC002544 TaxID=3154538 RepID=UPI0033298806